MMRCFDSFFPLRPSPRFYRVGAISLACLLAMTSLAGCSEDKPKLVGDRRPVFTTPALQADETAGLNPLQLADPTRPAAWMGYGGQGDQAPQHLAWSGQWTPRWQAAIGSGSQKDKVLLVSQPTSMGGAVFTLDSQGIVQATNLNDGGQLWRQKSATDGGDAVAQGGLVLTDRLVIAVLGDGQVQALNQSDGAVVWQQRLPNPVRLSPQADDGHVYIATIDNSLYALNLSDGRITWETRGLGEKARLLRPGSLTLTRDLLLLPTSTGSLLAVQPTTGRRLWEISLADDQRGDLIAALPGVVAPAVLADGVVYAAGFSNRLVALQARSGQAIWQASLGSAATPWISGNMMYVVTPDGQVACLFRSNGKIRWVKKLPEGNGDGVTVWFTPTLVDNQLLLANQRGQVVALSPFNGDEIAQHKIDGGLASAPIVAGGNLLWLTANGRLVAY